MLWRDTPNGGPNIALDEFGHKHRAKKPAGRCAKCNGFASKASARYCAPCSNAVKLELKREYLRKKRKGLG